MHLLKTENPRRPGTGRFARFDSYKEGMTVEEWLRLGIGTAQQLRWGTRNMTVSWS
jgi:hypothetical protein